MCGTAVPAPLPTLQEFCVSPLRLRRRPALLRRQRILRTVVIRQGITRVVVGCRPRALGQHGRAPGRLEALEYVLVARFEIAALARILYDVEQKLVARDPEIFPVALAQRALLSGLEAPVELARMRRCAAGHDRQQVLAVGWERSVW